jgi:hypothetical protein
MRSGLTIAELKDWEPHGAVWRALEVTEERAVVELCSSSGEPMDVVVGETPEVIEFVRARLQGAAVRRSRPSLRRRRQAPPTFPKAPPSGAADHHP